MTKLQNVIDTIREIECPVDQWTGKVIEAYKEYAGDDEYEIVVERSQDHDSKGSMAYSVNSNYADHEELIVLVTEGADGYVATVEDVYIK
jgi:hypothetical protein